MRHILLAVDETEASERAASFVERFFTGADVTITAVNVARARIPWGVSTYGWMPPAPYGGLYAWPVAGPDAAEAPGDTRSPAEDAAREVAARQAPEGAEIDVALGDPVEAIAAAAEERDADLIVVGSNDKSFWQRWFGRSISEELAKHAPRPVLVVA